PLSVATTPAAHNFLQAWNQELGNLFRAWKQFPLMTASQELKSTWYQKMLAIFKENMAGFAPADLYLLNSLAHQIPTQELLHKEIKVLTKRITTNSPFLMIFSPKICGIIFSSLLLRDLNRMSRCSRQFHNDKDLTKRISTHFPFFRIMPPKILS